MKQTIVSHIGVTKMGILEIQMRKQLVDGEITHELGFHRVGVVPGGDVELVLDAVNADLTRMGAGTVSTEEWNEVRTIAAAVWTEPKRQAFANMLQEQLAADAARAAPVEAQLANQEKTA